MIHETLAMLDRHLEVNAAGTTTGPIAFPVQAKIIATTREFPSDIAPEERQDAVRRAIIEVAKLGRGRLTPTAFDKALRQEVGKLKRSATATFNFVGWIASSAEHLPRQLTWQRKTVRFGNKTTTALVSMPAKMELENLLSSWGSTNLTSVEFAVDGRSPLHAAHRARKIFAELRGCIDLVVSFRQVNWLFMGPPAHPHSTPAYPIAVVLPVSEGLTADDKQQIKKYLPWVQKRLARHFAKDRLLVALRAYCAAVDTSDYEISLRRLWTTLEILAGSDQSKVVIQRVASLYKHRAFESEQLRAFADLRNMLTHSHGVTDFDRTFVDQLRTRVHQAFQIHFVKGHEVATFDELFRSVASALDEHEFASAERILEAAKSERRRRESAPL
jgi:hypothetical protein